MKGRSAQQDRWASEEGLGHRQSPAWQGEGHGNKYLSIFLQTPVSHQKPGSKRAQLKLHVEVSLLGAQNRGEKLGVGLEGQTEVTQHPKMGHSKNHS